MYTVNEWGSVCLSLLMQSSWSPDWLIPDGSLADLTMMSTSPEPLLKEEKEKESMNEMLVVDCVEEEKKKESLSIHSAHLSSQEDIQQFSATTDPELPSEQSSGTVYLSCHTINCD